MSPARSKAQQRLMGAALGGANFPAARAIRKSMTTEQIKDFASGSEKGKPQHVVHPKRKAHGAMVKEAHAHLGSAIPGFHKMPARQRMMAAQEHVRARKGY